MSRQPISRSSLMDTVENLTVSNARLENNLIDARIRISALGYCIRELLKGGEHEGGCDNEQGSLNEGGACQKHCIMSEQREADARKLIGEDNGTQSPKL